MGNRYFFSASQLPGAEDNRSQLQPHFHANLENTVVSGVNSATYFNIMQTSNDLPPSSFSSTIPSYTSTASGMSFEPYLYPSASSSSQNPTNYSHGPQYHNQLNIGGVSGTISNQLDTSRASFKRKSPATMIASDRGETSRNFTVGSSSNPPTSSNYIQPRPSSSPQGWPCDLSTTVPGYMSNNLLAAAEGTQRNIRGRHNPAFNLEVNIDGDQMMRNNTQHFHRTGSTSGMSVAGQLVHSTPSSAFHQRTLSSGPGYYNSRLNQSYAGSSIRNHALEIDGGYHQHRSSGGNVANILLPTLHDPFRQVIGQGSNSSYDQRTTYRAFNTYPAPVIAATSEDGRQRGVGAVAPSRTSRPMPILRRRNARNERTRTSHSRFQSFSEEENAHRRWASEGPIFYDSTIMFDQHRDMRLDIDDMSYEELLSLEERIGSVSTGLSEDKISRCLTKTNYCSPDQMQHDEECGKCAICLEEYKDIDNLGKLSCRHAFHYSCIKKWLLVKNVCPICKSPALADSSKEE